MTDEECDDLIARAIQRIGPWEIRRVAYEAIREANALGASSADDTLAGIEMALWGDPYDPPDDAPEHMKRIAELRKAARM